MKVCLRLREDQTFVFADPGAPDAVATYRGTHSELYRFSRWLNERGAHNGWTARVRALIVGAQIPTAEQHEQAQLIVRRSHFYHYEMIVGDQLGIDETVVKECTRLNMKYQTFGTTVRPLNNGNRYTRVITNPNLSDADRQMEGLHYRISQADIVYTFIPLAGISLRGKDVVTLCTATPRA